MLSVIGIGLIPASLYPLTGLLPGAALVLFIGFAMCTKYFYGYRVVTTARVAFVVTESQYPSLSFSLSLSLSLSLYLSLSLSNNRKRQEKRRRTRKEKSYL